MVNRRNKNVGNAAPIGGFFALEFPRKFHAQSIWNIWTRQARAVLTFRNARSALHHYLHVRSPRRVWLPAYACQALADACRDLAAARALYPITELLDPDIRFLGERLRNGDAVVVINYFGRPPSQEFTDWARSMDRIDWIEDCAQSLDPRRGRGDWAGVRLFSPRKLLGVIDGGVLVSRQPVPPPVHTNDLPTGLAEPSILRLEDADGRHADAVYARYVEVENAMVSDNAPMSRLSRFILEAMPMAPLAAARRRNFAVLHRQLRGLGLLPAATPSYTPFGYPISVAQRDKVARALRRKGIFVPVHWRTILGDAREFPMEHALSKRLLTVPCDHRYAPGDMRRVATAVYEALG